MFVLSSLVLLSDLLSSFRWVKDDKLFKEGMDGSGTLTADPDEELKFYEGIYRCYASNELGTAESGLINLTTDCESIFLLNLYPTSFFNPTDPSGYGSSLESDTRDSMHVNIVHLQPFQSR